MEFSNTLLHEHNLKLKSECLSNAIRQLHSWYYRIKNYKEQRKTQLNADEMEYFQKCTFFPEERLKEKYLCSICNKCFNLENNLKGHLFKCHKMGNLPFECDQCGKKFGKKTILHQHIQRMHAKRKYKCEFCSKLFATKSEHNFHSMVHTAEKPHVCEFCGKSFRVKTQLGYHITAIHTKVRAFKCNMCPKDFLKKRDLTDHVKSHLNIRDKICVTCGKGFSNCDSLRRHRQIHSAVKRYACKLCDAKFHQFVGLNAHMKRTHDIVSEN
ncbi:oocyte zinc finger protein XlCOF15-like [Lucilia sericata]|uniref:oocyte zinc finger protein XlCOF15-like n=1 Tax=Lucilia sericata TaxID=13632 RepID=UPI0018A867A6|nr:oocyte zinc finger protein XlCOF15-like [Lucilia sericata]